jgi:hypothetical protein
MNEKRQTGTGLQDHRTTDDRTAEDGRVLVSRLGLAVALDVSLRTVDRMLAAEEIVPVRLRGWSVRFYVPDVVLCLRNRNRKWGRGAQPEKLQEGLPDYRTTGPELKS